MTKIQLKRSNVLDGGSAKAPSVAQMEYGELAINYNTSDPTLFIKDSNNEIISLEFRDKEGEVPSGGTGERPSSPNIGDLFFDTTLNELLVWDGSAWVEVSGGAEVIVSDTAPAVNDLEEGSLWWNSSSDDLQLYVLYSDGGTLKWIEASPSGSADGAGSEVIISPVAPPVADYDEGTLWWNSDESAAILYVLYNDPTEGKRWIEASPMPSTPDVPGFPDLEDGSGDTLDARYVQTKPAFNVSQDVSGGLTIATDKIELKKDGSATFAVGDIELGGYGVGYGKFTRPEANVYINASSTGVFQITDPSDQQVIYLNADGSAAFSSRVITGSLDFGVNSVPYEALIALNNASDTNTNASIFASNKGGGLVWQSGPSIDTADTTSTIHSDGSASFAGGNINLASPGYIRAYRPSNLPGSGVIQAASDIGGVNNNVFQVETDGKVMIGGTLPTAPKTSLNADGSASFAGRILLGNDSLAGTSAVIASNNDDRLQAATIQAYQYNNAGYVFVGRDGTGSSTPQVAIKADGSASFAGTVTVEGNRPVIAAGDNLIIDEGTADEINVRERLTAARETFQELQVAVANATDFAGLKAAMLVALEDYAA